MSDSVKTVRVVSSHAESQGDFVEINESDFDAALHVLYVEPGQPPAEEEVK